MTATKAFMSWSSGKDSAFALYAAQQSAEMEIAGLLTSLIETNNRVSMHGVRGELLDRQAAALRLPLLKVSLPSPCPNEIYEARMAEACAKIKAQGIDQIIFGDLFLEDLRAYRIEKLASVGMKAVFPLWKRDTTSLAREMIASGLVAHVTCVDLRRLDKRFAGRRFDSKFLDELPQDVDPCGENGEFHTVATAGPMFATPILVSVGDIVERDGFIFADVIPD